MSLEAFFNRLRKVQRERRRWSRGEQTSAWRIYDHDIPEHRFVVEWYDGQVRVVWLPTRRDETEGRRPDIDSVREGTAAALSVPADAVHWAEKTPKVWGSEQYERDAGGAETRVVVEESGVRLAAYLGVYLDTGLYLDHRETRRRVREEAAGKRFLNLFCYTGSFTVFAADGDARSSVSVDLSRGWLDRARENLELNALANAAHRRERSDVIRWLWQGRETFDLAVVDPPSYSASKRMEGDFQVQRDHGELLRQTRRRITPGGIIYFSTHFRDFELDTAPLTGCETEELTPRSIPPDFRDRQVHRCWRVRTPSG